MLPRRPSITTNYLSYQHATVQCYTVPHALEGQSPVVVQNQPDAAYAGSAARPAASLCPEPILYNSRTIEETKTRGPRSASPALSRDHPVHCTNNKPGCQPGAYRHEPQSTQEASITCTPSLGMTQKNPLCCRAAPSTAPPTASSSAAAALPSTSQAPDLSACVLLPFRRLI